MYYFLAHFPKIDYTQINLVREKYDPNFTYLDPHIAVVFPVEATIGVENLVTHIESVLKNANSFEISLLGLKKSWDHYLYLTVDHGKDEIVSLHDSIYSSILESFYLKDVQYIPHITLGFFADRQAKFDKSDLDQILFNQSSYNHALKMAQAMSINISTKFDSLTLVSREDKNSQAVIIKVFKLKD